MGQRVLAIGLDGFEITLAERFVGEGLMPHFARLAARSVRYTLDHGADKFSGLAWEHVSSGRAPSDGARWSAVTFDKNHYTARQESTSYRPFLADVPLRSVVFDMPYCDLLFRLRKGRPWELAPAYDVTFAHNPKGEWTHQHLMSVNGKFKDFTQDDLLAEAERFAIGTALKVIDEVRAAIQEWPSFAQRAGLSSMQTKAIADQLIFLR